MDETKTQPPKGRRGTGNRPAQLDERKLVNDLRTAREAHDLLEHPNTKRAQETIRQNIIDKWTQTSLSDEAGQKLLRFQLHAWDQLFIALEADVIHGKQAQHNLDNIKRGNPDVTR